MNEMNSMVRVVLIDDDPMVIKALDTALKDLGYNVKSFQDPLNGLSWIKEEGCDIVIADICMPRCDGFEVLKKVKELDEGCDVIFITAHAQLDIAVRALREGATDFFEKPIAMSALHAAMVRTTRYRELYRKSQILTNRLNLLQIKQDTSFTTPIILGKTPIMAKLADEIISISESNATVLITGESGTGKELVAAAIHTTSPRKNNPFLVINCPSVPEDLFESELFGHRKGSFTGALESRAGYVEAAEGGTLFLDEVGDLPTRSQAKILRLLEQKTYTPIGENTPRRANVRIIAATNQPLLEKVEKHLFREDLYYRLNVCKIEVPPLRERREDIPLLALYFTLCFASEMKKDIEGLEDNALSALTNYDFPGNVRELRNIIESAVIRRKKGGLISLADLSLPYSGKTANSSSQTAKWPIETIKLADVEKQLYIEALSRTSNNISAAARLVGLSRSKLRRRLKALNIVPKCDE